MKRIVMLLSLMGVMLGVSAGAALAQATSETVNVSEPSSVGTIDPCTGEAILLEGRIHLMEHLTIDANGGLHLVGVDNQTYVGENPTTGTKYVLEGHNATSVNQHFADNGATEFTLASEFQVISQGSGDNFLFTQVIHGTVNSNGETTAEVVRIKEECTG